jgi:hypothetical protein
LEAGNDFGAKYMILESNHPEGLNELYLNPSLDPRLVYLGKYEDALIFQLTGIE